MFFSPPAALEAILFPSERSVIGITDVYNNRQSKIKEKKVR